MRLRFLIGIAAVIAIAAGSVAAALIVHAHETSSVHREQQEEAERAAHGAEDLATLSVDQLDGAAAFFQAELAGGLSRREFDLIARPLLREHGLSGTAFIQRVPLARRAAYERSTGIEIVEAAPGGGTRRAAARSFYLPITFTEPRDAAGAPLGFDLATEADRTALLGHARDTAGPAATGVIHLAGGAGLIVYRPVYRAGASLATVAERRAALVGFVAGSFHVGALAAAATSEVPGEVDVQLRTGHRTVSGAEGALAGASRTPFRVADRTWLLVISDPTRADVGLPLLLAIVGLCLAALLGALIFVWSRNERMQELRREASEDPLTGLKNRRRFDEDLRLALARARRERYAGALLMLDLDHFKLVNDTHGHQAGDQLIVEVAGALRRRTRESDTLARLGGDEFAVILPRCTVQEARLAAEGVAAAIREHAPDLDGAEPITASIGIAMFGDRPRSSADSIVSEADAAMYAAKDEGRDAIRVFDRDAILDDAPGR